MVQRHKNGVDLLSFLIMIKIHCYVIGWLLRLSVKLFGMIGTGGTEQ